MSSSVQEQSGGCGGCDEVLAEEGGRHAEHPLREAVLVVGGGAGQEQGEVERCPPCDGQQRRSGHGPF